MRPRLTLLRRPTTYRRETVRYARLSRRYRGAQASCDDQEKVTYLPTCDVRKDAMTAELARTHANASLTKHLVLVVTARVCGPRNILYQRSCSRNDAQPVYPLNEGKRAPTRSSHLLPTSFISSPAPHNPSPSFRFSRRHPTPEQTAHRQPGNLNEPEILHGRGKQVPRTRFLQDVKFTGD